MVFKSNYVFFSFWLLLWITSCSPHRYLQREFSKAEEKFQDFKGCFIYDLENKDTIFQYHSNRYFTPASNTKIFTLYTGLTLLGDSVPALRYLDQGDSLIIQGTGDPSFLNSKVFDDNKIFDFLSRQSGNLYLAQNFFSEPFGPGWSWEDYNFDFSCERSPFPIYGNLLEFTTDKGKLNVLPDYFDPYIHHGDTVTRANISRLLETNDFTYYPDTSDQHRQWSKPFKTDIELVAELLSDTLKREVKSCPLVLNSNSSTLYSIHIDSLYKPMMLESDNFIAEQILILCSSVLSDSLSTERTLDFMLRNNLSALPDKPVWRDGSGLSRYNVFTPRSIVWVWNEIYQKISKDRLFALIAAGGESGNIKNTYKADKPYIYGKTGSMTHVYCLSGFLITKKGRVFAFSVMNNNFAVPVRDVRKWMEGLMKLIHDKY